MITVTAPIQNQFYQRDSQKNASVKFSGSTDLPCKMVLKLDGKQVDEEKLSGYFQSYKSLKQGIYTAEFSINDIVQETVNFEIGRAFLCTGHSFAEGIGSALISSEKIFIQSNIDGAVPEITKFKDIPIYKKIKDYALTDVNGSKNDGIWSQLAENLSEKDDCPILIYHSSWGGTSIKQWAEASEGLNPSGYAGYNPSNPSDCPYYKTRMILKNLVKNTGLEAVLIMHGENDTKDTKENIIKNYKTVINAMRVDSGISDLPIYVSRSTWRSDTEKIVIQAQNEVIIRSSNVYSGPELIVIGDLGRKNVSVPISHPDYDEHLNAIGQKEAAKLWSDSIKDYHNKTVIDRVIDTMPTIMEDSSNSKRKNIIVSLLSFIILITLNKILKFGLLGVLVSLIVSTLVYSSNLFNNAKNANTD